MTIQQMLLGVGGKLSYVGTSFVSTNGTVNTNIDLPSGHLSSDTLFLHIVYENDTINRPTISGFTEITSRAGGAFDGALVTQVLMIGTASAAVTIPNDATYGGFVASMTSIRNYTSYASATLTQGTTTSITPTGLTNKIFLASHLIDAAAGAVISAWTLDSDYDKTAYHLSGSTPASVTGRGGAVGVIDNKDSATLTTTDPTGSSTSQLIAHLIIS